MAEARRAKSQPRFSLIPARPRRPVAAAPAKIARLRLTHITQVRETDGRYRIKFWTLNPRTRERKVHTLDPKKLSREQLQLLRRHYEAITKQKSKKYSLKDGIRAAFTDPHAIATVVKFLLAA